jgi:hypothetical protein
MGCCQEELKNTPRFFYFVDKFTSDAGVRVEFFGF